MSKFKSFSFSSIVILIYLVASVWVTFNLDKASRGQVITWDVSGYYLYLPSLFIYDDIKKFDYLDQVDEQYRPSGNRERYGVYPYQGDNNVLKFSSGMAFFYWPFFQLADTTAKITGSHPRDGYSYPYQLAIALSTIFFGLLGLIMLRAFLREYFSDGIVALCMLIIVFGTNFYTYTVIYPGMSHVYLFFLYASVLWLTMRWYQSFKWKHIILLAMAIGWAALSRPTEILLVFIPLLWGLTNVQGVQERLKLLWQEKTRLLVFILVLAAIGSVQLIYWKLATGSFVVYSYKGEGHFDFTSPHIIDGLFSYKKGWLIYTPIMVFALLGFIPLYRKNRSLFYMTLLFFIITLYVVFSWNPWWYGGGFSARALIQSYALLAIPLGYLLQWVYSNWNSTRGKLKSFSITAILIFFIALNLFQNLQYNRVILHWENMNKNYYWAVFGKLKTTEEDRSLINW